MGRKSNIASDDHVTTSVKLAATLHQKLKIAAATERRDMRDLITQSVEEYLEKNRNSRN